MPADEVPGSRRWSKSTVAAMSCVALLVGGGALGAKIAVDLLGVVALGETKNAVVAMRVASEKEHAALSRVVGEMVRQQKIANFLASRACKDCPRLLMPPEVREELESSELKESLGAAQRRQPYLYERR